jgi:hypothetical protein
MPIQSIPGRRYFRLHFHRRRSPPRGSGEQTAIHSIQRGEYPYRPLRAVAVTPDGQRAIWTATDRTVNMWDLETAGVLAIFTCNGAANFCVFRRSRTARFPAPGVDRHFLNFEAETKKSSQSLILIPETDSAK